MKKISKEIKSVIDIVNEELKRDKVLDKHDSRIGMLSRVLMANGIKPEARFFKMTTRWFDPLTGKFGEGPLHEAMVVQEEAEYIQFINE